MLARMCNERPNLYSYSLLLTAGGKAFGGGSLELKRVYAKPIPPKTPTMIIYLQPKIGVYSVTQVSQRLVVAFLCGISAVYNCWIVFL